jgi:hypothetical protein
MPDYELARLPRERGGMCIPNLLYTAPDLKKPPSDYAGMGGFVHRKNKCRKNRLLPLNTPDLTVKNCSLAFLQSGGSGHDQQYRIKHDSPKDAGISRSYKNK